MSGTVEIIRLHFGSAFQIMRIVSSPSVSTSAIKKQFLGRHRRLFAHPSVIRMLASTVLCRAVFTPVRSLERKLIEPRGHLLELYPALLKQNECPVKILARRWKASCFNSSN